MTTTAAALTLCTKPNMTKQLHGDMDWHVDRHVNGERSPQERANGKTMGKVIGPVGRTIKKGHQ